MSAENHEARFGEARSAARRIAEQAAQKWARRKNKIESAY